MSMFSNEFFDKLDPSYRILLQKLVEKLEVENEDYDAEDNEKFIKDFSKNYMLPIELWTELFEEYSCDDNPAFAYYQFYFPDVAAIELELDNSHKLMNLKAVFEDRRWEQLPRLIEFPNYEMDNCFMEYEETVDKPIPKKSLKKYEKMRKIYDKIMSERDNSEAWFFALTETDDVEFVKHNVEYRLGSDLTDKVLWKLYINYLEKFDVQMIIKASSEISDNVTQFSKYCRFFLDDKEMKEKYKNALEKNGEFEVPWKNVFSLEKFNRKVPKKCLQILKRKGRKPIDENKNRAETNRKRKIPPHYSSENVFQQNFDFRESFISYILKNSTSYAGQNLLKSCKYFFANYSHPFYYKLEINQSSKNEKEEIREESIYAEFKNSLENLSFKNIRLTTVFSFETDSKYSDNLLSKIISRISQCTAKYVSLKSKQTITFNELKFFIGHGNIIKVEMDGIKCLSENGKDVVIEEILRLTPKIMHFEINNPTFSHQSAQIIADLPYKNKISHFAFFTDKNEFEPNAFAEFIKKNASDVCQINYRKSNAQLEEANFDQIFQNVIDENWKSKPKPQLWL